MIKYGSGAIPYTYLESILLCNNLNIQQQHELD